MKRRFVIGLALAPIVGILACSGNGPPTARAGDDLEIFAGDSVELSGERSVDPDGDSLTYRWTLLSRPQDSAVTLSQPDSAAPVLHTDARGEYELSLVVNDGSDDSAPDTISVTAKPWFTDVTQLAGVSGGGAQNFETGYGSGAAWGDYNDDGNPDLYLPRDGRNLLYRNNGDESFTDVAAEAGVDSPLNSYSATWGDFDNDGNLDLYVVNHGEDQEDDLGHVSDQPNLLYRNNGDGTFTDVASEAGVDHAGHGIGASWVDLYDGWLGIYVWNLGVLSTQSGRSEANLLFRNNGDGTFAESAVAAGIAGGADELVPADRIRPAQSGLSFGALWFDYDGNGSSDLFVTGENGASYLYRNDGNGAFEDVTEDAGLLSYGKARGVVGGDYDNDGNLDLYVTGIGQNRLWRNNGDGTFTDVAAAAGVAGSSASWGAGFIDFDNDGRLDLYVANGAVGSGQEAKQQDRLYRNNGDGTFVDVTSVAGVGNEGVARAVAFADYDGDKDFDIYVVNADGGNALYRNEIGSRMNWLQVRLLGTSSNMRGIGAKVEVTTRDQVVRTASPSGGSGYLGQNDEDLLFGLGSSDRADVKVTWPSGIVQDFWNIRSNDLVRVREATIEGSCPMVFGWNGSAYTFASDILGSAVTGFGLGPGVYRFPIDTDEYLKIEDLKPRDGAYSIQIVELLNEIIYLDNAKLLVVDHPSDMDVFPDERLMLFPPFPEFGIRVAKGARPPVAAFDDRGNDVLSEISKKDGVYAEDFAFLPYEGFAEEHSIILDLGDLSDADTILLLLSGWTNYVTSYAVFSASQDGVAPMLPRLEVVDEQGNWIPVAMDMGFPAGQPKTMTYDLTGKFLTDEYKIKITTNLQVFWDEILVNVDTESTTPRVTELELSGADLHWKGYPILLGSAGDRGMRPVEYDYERVEAEKERWVVPEGRYTRYGDVVPLLSTTDDMFVIMRHGDEVTLSFGADGLPELPSGWTRSTILYLDGFLKYVDPYVAHASSVEPLPFHAMSGYPYPSDEDYPRDEAHLVYLREYNTRIAPSTDGLE